MSRDKYFLKSERYTLDEFLFKNGRVLKNVTVDYGVMGTPKYDDEGNIINAVLFCHSFEGDFSLISEFNQLTDSGHVLSKEDYFFISITSLGFPGSCSPSTTDLKSEFPNYYIEDLINFKKKFIHEKFTIKKLKGILGYSFGGCEALGWAVLYPDDMDFVIHFSSSYKTIGYKYLYAKFTNTIIESNPNYYLNVYDESISNLLIAVSQVHYITSYSKDWFNRRTNDEIDMMMESHTENGLFYDVYDLKYRNDFLISFNIEDMLDRIKTRLLIIGVDNTNYYIPKYDSIPLHNLVEGSELLLMDIGDEPNELDYLYTIEDDIKKFIDSV